MNPGDDEFLSTQMNRERQARANRLTRSEIAGVLAKAKELRDAKFSRPKRPAPESPLDERGIPRKSTVNATALSEADIAGTGPIEGPAVPAPGGAVHESATAEQIAPAPVASTPARSVTPRAPTQDQPDDELATAQKRRGGFNGWAPSPDIMAALSDQMESASDIAGGTKYHSGAAGRSIRAAADRNVQDVLQRRQEGRAAQTTGLQREAGDRAQAGEERAAGADLRVRAMNDPTSRESAAARAQGVALYPDKVKRIPPEEFRQMSANDLKTLFGELPGQVPKGTGAGGMKPPKYSDLKNIIPPETVNLHAGLKRIGDQVGGMGGWDKVGGVGFFEGMFPSLLLKADQQQLRQDIKGVTGAFLQSKGGKAITSQEERIILQSIAADPYSPKVTPQMLGRALEIIHRGVQGNTKQATAHLPPATRKQLLEGAGLPPSWATDDTSVPLGQPTGPRIETLNGQQYEIVD